MEIEVSYSAAPRCWFHAWDWFRMWSGEKPDSYRIPLVGLLTRASSDWSAFPFLAGTVAGLISPPRSQWRGRAGFSPASH